MIRLTAWSTALMIATTSVGASGARADVVPNHLAAIASRGVVAVRDAFGVKSGFRFGAAPLVIAAAAAKSGIRLISADGSTAVVGPEAGSGSLVVTGDGGLTLAALAVDRSGPRNGAVAYVLGPPLGYGGQSIHRVVLKRLRRSGAGEWIVTGRLARRFEGAPVVTPGGAVVGAVDTVGPRSWRLAPVVTLRLLLRRGRSPSSGGLSTVLVVSVVLLLVLLCAAVCCTVIVRRRRSRRGRPETLVAIAEHERLVSGISVSRSEQFHDGPLVQRREPAETVTTPEDFEVVLKPNGEPR